MILAAVTILANLPHSPVLPVMMDRAYVPGLFTVTPRLTVFPKTPGRTIAPVLRIVPK